MGCLLAIRRRIGCWGVRTAAAILGRSSCVQLSSRKKKMPEHCAAYSCSNRRTVENRARGITFHKFPKDKDMRKKWEVALRRKRFTASNSSVLCCEHFKEDDFDRTGQIVRLRDGVIPSIFSFPVRLQRPEKGRSTSTSRRAKESLSVASQDDPDGGTSDPEAGTSEPEAGTSEPEAGTSEPEAGTSEPEAGTSEPEAGTSDPEAGTSDPQPQPNYDHGYALPASPTALKIRLSEALARVESLEREKKNAMAREKRAWTTVESLLRKRTSLMKSSKRGLDSTQVFR